jgi:hypothetical protein
MLSVGSKILKKNKKLAITLKKPYALKDELAPKRKKCEITVYIQ